MVYRSSYKPHRSDFSATGVVGTLWRLFGDDVALSFWEGHRGIRVFVPMQVREAAPLAASLGIEIARALASEIGPVRDLVPHLREEQTAYDVMELAKERRPAREVARTLGISERSVCSCLQKARFAGEHP